MNMTESYNALSVFVDLYPTVYKDVIPAGTEIGRAVVNGGNAPYTYEVVNELEQPSTIYQMKDDRIFTLKDISIDDLEKIIVKVTETPIEAKIQPVAESDDNQEDPTVVQLGDEEENEDTEEKVDTRERIPYAYSLEVSPLVEVSSAIQDSFSKPNMVYKITTDIDLGGGTLVIPKNTTLDFQGGTFKNGVLSGWINIKECNYKIFDNVTFAQGSYIPYMKPEYFGAVGDGETDSASGIQTMFNVCINAAKVYEWGAFEYKDLRGTKFIFQGNYIINSNIIISGATYGLSIEGLNLTVGDNFDTVANAAMLIITADTNTLNISKSIFDGAFKVYNIILLTQFIFNSTFDTDTIMRYLEVGLNFSVESDSDYNHIINCEIYQFPSYNSAMPEGVNITKGIGVNITKGISFIIDKCKFRPSWESPLSCDTKVILTDCSLESINLNPELVRATIGEESIVSNCKFINIGLDASYNVKITDNYFYFSKGDGSSLIRANTRTTNSSKATIIQNNYFYNNPKAAEGKYPITRLNNTELNKDSISVINNHYSGTNDQPPFLSSLMTDSILKLITNNGIIWSDLSQDNKKAIQIGNILIQWGNLSNLNLQEIDFLRPFVDINYSLITNWEDHTSKPMVKKVNRFSIGNGLPTTEGFIPSYIAIGISSISE